MKSSRYLPLLLGLILAVAAGLRFYNLRWDNGLLAHPDERSTVAFYAPTIRWPEAGADILDPRASTLNPFWDVGNQSPRSYTYGHFPLYVLVGVAHLLRQLAPMAGFLAQSETMHGYAYIGRALMALADLGTVYLLFLLGRRLYGEWAGLLAAALSALTVLQIQLAHFFAVDPVSAMFTFLALYNAIRMYDRPSPGAAIWTGLGIGLAVASKFSALPVAFAPVLAAALVIAHKEEVPQSRMIGLAGLALGVSLVVFAITSPFVLLDFENFRRAVLEEQGNMVSGVADWPFTRQYRGTTAYWYFIVQQIRWGMGWPLGLFGFAGLGWVLIKAVLGRAQPGEWIILAWIVFYFGPTGLFLAKFMRYMVPVVPLLTLFGAGLALALWRSAAFPRSIARPAAMLLIAIVLAGTAFWAAAFVNGVYGTEHPWRTFSRWIYENVPDGACLAWEHWDDRLPTDLPRDTPRLHGYLQPRLDMYEEDTAQKYEELRETLRNCDYIILATNRLWRTIPRLPERYPMSSRYYEALFSGELGFEQIYAVETPPRLGPFVFSDQAADESFTVYDHPKPILFQKSRQLSEAEWEALLGGKWEEATPGYVGQPTLLMRLRGKANAPPAPKRPPEERKPLMLDQPVDQLPVVADFRWNGPANRSALLAIVVWWLALALIGAVAWPLTFLLFHRLPDRGYGLSRSLGLLLVGYFVWIQASLGWLQNRLSTIIIGLLILAGMSGWLAFRHRQAMGRFLGRHLWFLLATEALFTLVYLVFVYLRLLNPDLWQPWQGGEKMLEIGFLNAIVKSAEMPPYDPFFAGGIINYYYYGLFLVNILIKLTGIRPAIAFNLAVPTLAALTAVNAFSLAGNLAGVKLPFRRQPKPPQPGRTVPYGRFIASGLLAVLFVLFMGNLEGAAQLLRNLAQFSSGQFQSAIPGLETLIRAAQGLPKAMGGQLMSYNYWDPSRVIPQTINEFPFFSFLFADLHPHMINMPFTILFLSLAYNWLRQIREGLDETRPEAANDRDKPLLAAAAFLLRWLAFPFVLGGLAVINTWDLPTYLGLALAVFLLAWYRGQQGPLTPKRVGLMLLGGGLLSGLLLALTYLLYAPFFIHYQTPAETGLGLVHTKTNLGQHLKIWGFFGLVIVSWLAVSLLYPATRNGLLRLHSLVLRRWNVWPHLSELYHRLVGDEGYPPGLGTIGGVVVVVALLLFVVGYRVPAYLLPPLVIALALLFRREVAAETAYITLLIFTGLLVLLGVEFFFLRDFLGGGDYYRMNSLFKFFIQVWIIFGLAAAVALPQVWDWAWRWPVPAQLAWRGVVILLLVAGLVYPVFATPTRVDDRFPGLRNRPPIGTLDGLAYMTVGTFEWPAGSPIHLKYDYEAIRWLQQNVEGTPIIAEAKIGYYREGGMRVAAYTGLPSLLGGLHQNEQRYAAQIGRRDPVVNELWTNPDPARTLQLIDQLDVSYIYVGQVERITYYPTVGEKFERLRALGELELIFENEQTRIYKRKR